MARAKKRATACVDQRDRAGAARWLGEARRVLNAVPVSDETRREDEALAQIEADLAAGARERFMKRTKYQAYQRNRSQPYK
jgi:hypothetical protein